MRRRTVGSFVLAAALTPLAVPALAADPVRTADPVGAKGAVLAAAPAAEDRSGVTGNLPSVARSMDADQAIAIGFMLDSPRPLPVITKGLAIGEGLRQRYGIDTGHPVADREAAARRAQSELLDRASFTAEEINAMARSLGFSLDPRVCGATCDNVRRLVTIELQKQLLERFVLVSSLAGSEAAHHTTSDSSAISFVELVSATVKP